MKSAIYKQDIESFFLNYDERLSRQPKDETYVVLGGAALVLLEIIDRSTNDIDVGLDLGCLESFSKVAAEFGISVQKVTQCTSVDFRNCKKKAVFSGRCLKIESISPRELIKSKIERFDKQDSQDIERLIKYLDLSYPEFLELYADLEQGFAGNFDHLRMKARTVVERHYSGQAIVFRKQYKLSFE